MGVDGVLRAGRGGGLGAVAAGAVQRVSAAPGSLGTQSSQGQGELLLGRTGLGRDRQQPPIGQAHGETGLSGGDAEPKELRPIGQTVLK